MMSGIVVAEVQGKLRKDGSKVPNREKGKIGKIRMPAKSKSSGTGELAPLRSPS
jgi:hypothetical protein